MTNELKQRIMDGIRSNTSVFYRAGENEYRIRCPFCGDSQKNPKNAHCYIHWTPNPSEPLLYICFKCNRSGSVNQYFLEQMGIHGKLLNDVSRERPSRSITRVLSPKESNLNIVLGTPDLQSPQVQYIEQRLGKGFQIEDYERFKIIWNIENLVPYIASKKVLYTLPSNRDSISFLSDDRLSLIIRPFDHANETFRWKTLNLESVDQKTFYTIAASLDLFTTEPVVINIAEGIFDILSVYKNFSDERMHVYIAALGSNYRSALDHMIAKGIFGTNVSVRVFADQDVQDKIVRSQLKGYRWMFDKINIYRNGIGKDVGVPIEEIQLVETRV